jgi:hypothetical protein
MTSYLSDQWIDKIFDAKQVKVDGVVRRSVSSVNSSASEALLIAAVKSRGFHMIQSGDQYVILCHSGELKIWC